MMVVINPPILPRSDPDCRLPGCLFTVYESSYRNINFRHLALRINEHQKQSTSRAAFFAVRVSVIVLFISGLASLPVLTPRVNRQYQETVKPLQPTAPHPMKPANPYISKNAAYPPLGWMADRRPDKP